MPELRWTLLIVGVVFIAALAWWEFRRRGESSHVAQDRLTPTMDPPEEPSLPAHVHREPTISLPEIRTREPQELPVLEIPEDSLVGLRVDGTRPEQEAVAEEPEEAIVPEPELPPPSDAEADRTAQYVVEPPKPATPPPPPLGAVTPVVEWPGEDVRRIIALRLVSSTERFQGRALRQALAAEGFVFGRFSIFHKPGADSRAILSAASLSKPGIFTLESMDTQRFGGLNLFAVLPGPLSPSEAFEELLATARSLNDRLQGGLQDELGKPLTSARIATLRESHAATTAATGGAPSAEAPAVESAPPASTPAQATPQEGAESSP